MVSQLLPILIRLTLMSVLQVDNFVQYPKQHSYQHAINEKSQMVREQNEGKGNDRECS